MDMHSFAMKVGERALVLKEFSVNHDGPEYVHIVARKEGLISWFLTLLGINVTTTFRVFSDRIVFEKGSLSGNLITTMPLRSLSIATCGYTKPFILIVACISSFLYSCYNFYTDNQVGGWISLFVAVSSIIGYIFMKALLIAVVSHSSWYARICFKRSFIEGVKVDYEKAKEVITLINRLTMEQASK